MPASNTSLQRISAGARDPGTVVAGGDFAQFVRARTRASAASLTRGIVADRDLRSHPAHPRVGAAASGVVWISSPSNARRNGWTMVTWLRSGRTRSDAGV